MRIAYYAIPKSVTEDIARYDMNYNALMMNIKVVGWKL